MSFDMNLVGSKNLSNVQASAKSQDGGAGNTGYFMRGEEEDIGFRFKDQGSDIFEKSNAVEDEEEESFLTLFLRFIESLIDKIKALFNLLGKH